MDISPTIQHLHGRIRPITGTDPDAGTEISETVPARRRWRLLTINFSLVTDVTVADRYVRLIIDDGTTVLYISSAIAAHVASLTRNHSYGVNGQTHDVTYNTFNTSLPDLILISGFRIRTATQDLQAADNFTAPQMLVEEWIDP